MATLELSLLAQIHMVSNVHLGWGSALGELGTFARPIGPIEAHGNDFATCGAPWCLQFEYARSDQLASSSTLRGSQLSSWTFLFGVRAPQRGAPVLSQRDPTLQPVTLYA
jgi:hypothetical protein